jgi:hypothetical protein
MYKQVLNSISDIDIFPVISLILFVSFFALMLIRVIYARKDYVEHMSNLPLEEDSLGAENAKQSL